MSRDEDNDTLVVAMPEVVDQVALARLYGEPLFAMSRPSKARWTCCCI
jgi:segregation and condensation protein A